METHRYERRHLASHTVDAYNALQGSQPIPDHSIEYWTNGRTTLLNRITTSSSSFHNNNNSSLHSVTQRRMSVTRQPKAGKNNIAANERPRHEDAVIRNSLIAGSVAGIFSTIACHPFDVLRTKMQSAAMTSVISGEGHGGNRATSLSASRSASHALGPVRVFVHTFQNGGVRALYTGLTLPLAAQAVYKGTVFTVNNLMENFLVDWKTQERYKIGILEPYHLKLTDRFFCGFVGGAVNAALFVTPVEYVRNQQIKQHSMLAAGEKIKNPFLGPIDVIRRTIQSKQGIQGLWRGLGVTVARDSLGCGCFFYVMEWSQRRFTRPEEKAPSLGVTMLSGALAGLGFWFAALPIDTVKTWIQSGMEKSFQKAVRKSYREHGVIGTLDRLFRGWQLAYGRGLPAAAITVTSYSFCYRYLKDGE